MSVNKALLLSALTIDTDSLGTGVAASDTTNSAGAGNITFASPNNAEADALDLWDISVGVFQQAIENIATLRADNGGTMSRLRFAAEDVSLQKTNLIAANAAFAMSISQLKVRTWPSIRYSYRHQLQCWLRLTVTPM